MLGAHMNDRITVRMLERNSETDGASECPTKYHHIVKNQNMLRLKLNLCVFFLQGLYRFDV